MSVPPISSYHSFSFPLHSYGFQPKVKDCLRLRLDDQRTVRIKEITQEVRNIIKEEERKARVVLIDSATQLPTELVDIIESYLNDLPQAPRKPGAKAEQPLPVTELPIPVRVCLFAESALKKMSLQQKAPLPGLCPFATQMDKGNGFILPLLNDL